MGTPIFMLTKVTIAINYLFILHKTTCLLIFAGIYSISYELLILHSELGLLLCCFKPEQLQEPHRVKTEIKVRKTY